MQSAVILQPCGELGEIEKHGIGTRFMILICNLLYQNCVHLFPFCTLNF